MRGDADDMFCELPFSRQKLPFVKGMLLSRDWQPFVKISVRLWSDATFREYLKLLQATFCEVSADVSVSINT